MGTTHRSAVAETRYTAARLGPILASRGIAAAWLAAQMGVSRSHLSHAMRGRKSLSRAAVLAGARALDKEVSALFDPVQGRPKERSRPT
jgi:transcriptional regulator with XRE-family HTH domain